MPGTVGAAPVGPRALSTGWGAIHDRPTREVSGCADAYGQRMSLPNRAEVVVVAAGLAGLSVATRLAAAGRDVHVVDAAGHAGGRLATERIDGFLVDRGFQVLNTGYPRVADLDVA